MVTIGYGRSASGIDNCFDIRFDHRVYIPGAFFEQHENGRGAELNFYITLLGKFGMLEQNEDNIRRLIWSTHYDCSYDGIPFTMIYDEDNDMVSFSVSPENLKYKTVIAEHIRQLVEKESKNINV